MGGDCSGVSLWYFVKKKKKKFEAKIIDIGSQVFLLNFARNLTS